MLTQFIPLDKDYFPKFGGLIQILFSTLNKNGNYFLNFIFLPYYKNFRKLNIKLCFRFY